MPNPGEVYFGPPDNKPKIRKGFSKPNSEPGPTPVPGSASAARN